MKKISEKCYELNETQLKEVEINSDKLAEQIKSNELNEGILGGILGGLTGAAIGPTIGRAICKALGIERGLLYEFLTSRVFTSAVASYMGYKI